MPSMIPPEAVVVAERVQWATVIPVALLAGIISVAVVNLIAVLSQVLGVLSIALVGVVAVLYYARKRQLALSTSTGLRIGLVAGFFAFLAHGTLALIQFTSNREMLIQEIRKAMDQTSAGAANPQARQLLERMLTPDGILYFIILSMLVMMVLFVGLGSIGGALAASITRRRKGD